VKSGRASWDITDRSARSIPASTRNSPSASSSMKKGCPDNPVRVAGLVPFSATDFPDKLAAVVFLQGCPWRCGYCHNPELIPHRGNDIVPWTQVTDFLNSRRGLLDGVVFSGGEPTLQPGLGNALRQVRLLGFKTGLHTAGIYPGRLSALLPWLDWVGMDIKTTRSHYPVITGNRASGNRAWCSAEIILGSGVASEFRTTVHPDLHDADRLAELASELAALGVRHYVIQKCMAEKCRDPALRKPARPLPGYDLLHRLGDRFERFSLRNC